MVIPAKKRPKEVEEKQGTARTKKKKEGTQQGKEKEEDWESWRSNFLRKFRQGR